MIIEIQSKFVSKGFLFESTKQAVLRTFLQVKGQSV
jgi:hypothetical protein